MKEKITKKSLVQSIDLISELDLNENDLNNLYSKFKKILDKPEIETKLGLIKELEGNQDLKSIMNLVVDTLSLDELNLIMEDLIKDEDLIDYVQDLFLEKLL